EGGGCGGPRAVPSPPGQAGGEYPATSAARIAASFRGALIAGMPPCLEPPRVGCQLFSLAQWLRVAGSVSTFQQRSVGLGRAHLYPHSCSVLQCLSAGYCGLPIPLMSTARVGKYEARVKTRRLLGSRQWKERHCAIVGRCGSSRLANRIASMCAIACHVSAAQVQLCIPALSF